MIITNEILFMCLIFAALFVFSGIFSASETAFFNLKSYDKVDFKTKEASINIKKPDWIN